MAFIRSYQAQGDPRARRTTLRAGRLYHSKLLSTRTRRGSVQRQAFRQAALRGHVARLLAHGHEFHTGGDPFRLRMPKFIRKLSIKKIGRALQPLAQFAAPVIGGLAFGAPGAALASSLFGSRGGGGVAPELAVQPASTGPPSQVAMQYQVGGTEVTPATSGQVYNVFQGARSRSSEQLADYDPGDEDEEDVADVGDEDEYFDEEE